MSTLKKVLLLLLSIIFLCAGGLCSAFLVGANGGWPLFAIIMSLLCIYSVVEIIIWLAKPNTNFYIKPIPLLLGTILVVVLAYVLGLSGTTNIRIAG